MKINFCLPPGEMTGGPLAIMEYANGFMNKGHDVSITTYPLSYWPMSWNKKPFPWYEFKGEIHYCNDIALKKNIDYAREILLNYCGESEEKNKGGFDNKINNLAIVLSLISSIPDCDINIATYWLTAYSVFFSRKGKPVYFMQHYEEVFERKDYNKVLNILSIRGSYELPMYKIANSSWLKKIILERYGQNVPFSLNAINLTGFRRRTKLSQLDGVIRLLSYGDEREWKGFAEVAYVVSMLREKYGNRIEWHVFGKEHSRILSNNRVAPYIIHERLTYTELAELYAECDIFISGSWYESFPLPPLEAMAAGTAVVTTIYGTEDYCINEYNCLCIKPRMPEKMYKSVKRLIDDIKLRKKLEKNGLITVSQFSWKKAVDDREKILVDIYDDRVEYNRFEPIGTNIKDGNGIDFSSMPKDLKGTYEDGIFIRQGERLFQIQNNCKRLIGSSDLIEKIEKSGTYIKDIEIIEMMRIPMGFTIWREEDLLY